MNDNRLKAEGRDGELVKVRKEGMKEEGGGEDTKSMSQLLICLTPWSHLGKLKSESELGRRTFANERPVADAFLYLFATVCPSSDATPLVASHSAPFFPLL